MHLKNTALVNTLEEANHLGGSQVIHLGALGQTLRSLQKGL